MRIGIDARFYGSFGKGLGRYTEKLIQQLELIDHENDYYIFLRKENWAAYQPKNSRFTKVLADYRWYTLAEQFFMPIKLWSYHLDIMHFTHFNVPLLYFKKFYVTIHDLILYKYPTQRATTLSPVLYKLKHLAYKMIIISAVKRSKKIIAVSNYVKGDISDQFNVDPDKISVTYESADSLSSTHAPQNTDTILGKYKVRKPYLLYVGNVYPHKNIEGLLKAFKKARLQRPEMKLVLVGKDDYFFNRIKREVDLLELRNHVNFTGFVTDGDLPEIYRQGRAYIFPSFYEGFGLPALEACLYGLPVISSNSSSLPEVLGEAALYFDPHDIDDMSNRILQVLSDPKLAKSLINKGEQRIKMFSWDKMARATLKLYTGV